MYVVVAEEVLMDLSGAGFDLSEDMLSEDMVQLETAKVAAYILGS